MLSEGYEVPPLNRKQIRRTTDRLRKTFGLNKPWVPIIELIELVLPQVWNGFEFEVRDMEEMGETHGLSYPEKTRIILREDVYCGAIEGKGRDRGTAAHELGHCILHSGIGFARTMSQNKNVPPYKNSEWQAKAFAGELLMSHEHIHKCRSPSDASLLFGVSLDSAEYQWAKFTEEGLIK